MSSLAKKTKPFTNGILTWVFGALVRAIVTAMCFIILPLHCSSNSSSASPVGANSDVRVRIVEKVNQYRSSVGRRPLQYWTEKEGCTDQQACSDAQSGVAHGAFGDCGERAQNECPQYRTEEGLLTSCLPSMWAEGPGGGHYENMISTRYSRMSVGLCTSSSGRIWCVMNFYP